MTRFKLKKNIMSFKKYLKIFLLCLFCLNVKAQDVNIKIHLLGAYSSKVSIMPLVGTSALKPIIEKQGLKNGNVIYLTIPKENLPGQFMIRFDYQEKVSSTPYPSEKYIFIGSQDIELWVRPKHVNNPDSTFFQKGEKENSLFVAFSNENGKLKGQMGLLQGLLMGIDQPKSKFYSSIVEEYERRRLEYNKWISAEIEKYHETFVSNTFQFQYVPPSDWKGSQTDRMFSLIEHYFDNQDFKNPLLIKTTDLKEWMNSYVNLYGTMSRTVVLRDSLFALAGKRAIEKAKLGNPLVYGWMVDYFYKGYTGFNMAPGIKMLEPYLDDPRCLTSKKLEIEKRLQGIESIRPGMIAPDFTTKNDSGKPVQFLNYKTNARYKLVLFWSADCQHCKDLVKDLYPWYLQAGGKKVMEVFALSVDYTDTETKVWKEAIKKLSGWENFKAEGGINGPTASVYFVLGTPVMVLVDAKTNKIVALPETIEQLQGEMK